ncbi:GntR family transcriptional regulator [Bradyrhizobium sp. WSM3983]|uniref:GntR family transcriptional regulator n=1 Tax=Bradyrhizobium sp. WSM3983 TaxID=1038867 RepID=UPI00047F3F2A|nr:GntR family transcriptional regulator [Bradyrhizobium sp. WSM3983]
MGTRYANVAKELTEAIATGRYPVGSLLPNELELAERFSVSRSTIRAAMRELQTSGLVSRKKSAGTKVEASSPPHGGSGFVQALGSIEAVQQFGRETVRDIQDVADEVADDELAVRLGCRAGRRWLRISSVRLIPGDETKLPICWTDIYIDAAFASDVRARMKDHAGIFSTLVEQISGRQITEIRQDICASGVPGRIASAMRAETGSYALEIRRQYYQSPSSLVEVSLSVHPADRYRYSIRLTRQGACQPK